MIHRGMLEVTYWCLWPDLPACAACFMQAVLLLSTHQGGEFCGESSLFLFASLFMTLIDKGKVLVIRPESNIK